jgi:hypothetical protein
MRKSLLQALLPPLIAGLFLGVVIVLGKAARDALRGLERSSIAFADIDCPPPPGQERADFLGEVQYLGGLQDRVDVLDEGLAERLAGAFAKHPWVEKVERVEIAPSRKVRVQVVYRTPVLAVPLIEHPQWQPGWTTRLAPAVDGEGVLLPVGADNSGLPMLRNTVPQPTGPAGTPWGNAIIEKAARTAGYLRSHQDRLHLEKCEVKDDGLILTTTGGTRILWGHPPGDQQPDEAPAAEKVKRLLDYCEQHGGLGSEQEPTEHDVRPRDQAIHRPLPQRQS